MSPLAVPPRCTYILVQACQGRGHPGLTNIVTELINREPRITLCMYEVVFTRGDGSRFFRLHLGATPLSTDTTKRVGECSAGFPLPGPLTMSKCVKDFDCRLRRGDQRKRQRKGNGPFFFGGGSGYDYIPSSKNPTCGQIPSAVHDWLALGAEVGGAGGARL